MTALYLKKMDHLKNQFLSRSSERSIGLIEYILVLVLDSAVLLLITPLTDYYRTGRIVQYLWTDKHLSVAPVVLDLLPQ